jgi:integrase
MNIVKRKNGKGDKIYFTLEWGRGSGERMSTGVFIYTRPKDQIQKNHNKEALLLVETKKSELQLEQQALGSGFIPAHKFKANFFDYYREFVKANQRKGNRHLSNSLTQFELFVDKTFIAPIDITENLVKRFRQYLLDKFSGDTPANYFHHFKQVVRAATKDNYWRHNPAEEIKSKTKPPKILKENLEADEYIKLLTTPCLNEAVKEAFIFCCYSGLRYVDVEALKWADIKGNQLTTRIIQHKTGQPVILTLHPIAKAILDKRRKSLGIHTFGRVFELPTHDGCNQALEVWIKSARIGKHITWSCARLSFSILLQDKSVDTATVAYLMGHTTSEQVNKTYRRHRPLNQEESVNKLPLPESMPYFLNN